MIIKNGLVYQEDKKFVKRDLYLEHGRIVEKPYSTAKEEIVDAEGLLVLPGLIDVHSHGAVGCDFSDGSLEGLRKILAYEYAHGITSYCPTSMTLEKDALYELFEGMRCWQDGRGMSRVQGLHMEGPFLDMAKRGAHRKECILAPDVDFFRKCNQACGKRIRIVTLAPGGMRGNGSRKEGGDFSGQWAVLDVIERLCRETVVSLGHTCADYDTAKAALAAGASHITHLFNAMMPFDHREPGLIGAAAEDVNCMAELICDGVHVHESMVRAAFKLFPGRIVLISDSMRATGMGDGIYDLGGQMVEVKGPKATLTDGRLAGSVTNLYDCMCQAVKFGIPMEEAIAAATMNPARSIGIYNEVGSLSPGKHGDVLLADRELKLLKVI